MLIVGTPPNVVSREFVVNALDCIVILLEVGDKEVEIWLLQVDRWVNSAEYRIGCLVGNSLCHYFVY